MTKQHYKNLSLTFLIILIWSVYVFFDYFSETDGEGFIKLTLFFDYYTAAMFSGVLALINIILRITKFRKNGTENFKDSIFYILSGFANMFLTIVWYIYLLISKQTVSETLICLEPACIIINSNLIFGVLVLVDIYCVKNIRPTANNKFAQ